MRRGAIGRTDTMHPTSAPARLKILMVAARFFPFTGGTETHVYEAGTRLVAEGHEVTVVTADPAGELPPDETVNGMHVVRLRSYPKGRDLHFAPALVRFTRRGTWDVVHVQGYHTLFAPLAMLTALVSGIPYAVTFHSGGHSSGFRNRLRGMQHAVLAPLIGRATRLIGVSEFEADFFSARIGVARDRFAVVPNGAKLPLASAAAPKPDPQNPLIVSPGRLELYKGHHRALSAFRSLLVRCPGARLRLLGEGPYEHELRRQVGELGLGDKVEIGAIPARDRGAMADLMSSASLVVLLSDYEAHPVAVLEALSLRVPVLTSDTSGFRELAERRLVRSIPLSSSPDAVASAMLETMAAGPLAATVKLPDWQECAQRLLAIYRTMLRGQPTGEYRPVASAAERESA